MGEQFKESVLKRVLPPNAESIRSVSVDVRIAEQTIRNWIAKVDQGILGDDVQLGPRQLGAPEKFALLLEAAGLKEDERGPWIRKKDYTLSICNYGNRSSETPWQKKAIKISKT
jgi:transposase